MLIQARRKVPTQVANPENLPMAIKNPLQGHILLAEALLVVILDLLVLVPLMVMMKMIEMIYLRRSKVQLMQAALNKILNSRKMNKMRWMSLITGSIQSKKVSMLVQILTQLRWLVVVEIPIEPDRWLLIKILNS